MEPPNKEGPAADGDHAAGQGTTGQQTGSSTARPAQLTKWGRILGVLLGGRALHRFDAERLGDHCLHSTIAKLEAKGVTILRESERVPGFAGTVTHVMRYRLAPISRARALELLWGCR